MPKWQIQENFIGILAGNALTLFLGLLSNTFLVSKFGFSSQTEKVFLFLICGVTAPSVIGSTLTTVLGKRIPGYWYQKYKSPGFQFKILLVFVVNGFVTYYIAKFSDKTTNLEIPTYGNELIAFSFFQLIVLLLQSFLYATQKNFYSSLTGVVAPLLVIITLLRSDSIDNVIIAYPMGLALQILILVILIDRFQVRVEDNWQSHEKLTLSLFLNVFQNIVISTFNFGARKSLAGSQGNSLSIFSVAERIPISVHNLTSNSVGLEILYTDKTDRRSEQFLLRARLDLVNTITTFICLGMIFLGPALYSLLLMRGEVTENDFKKIFPVVMILTIGNIANGFATIVNNYLYSKGRSNFLSYLGLIQYITMSIVILVVEKTQNAIGFASLLFTGALVTAFFRVYFGTREWDIDSRRILQFGLFKMIFSVLSTGLLWIVDESELIGSILLLIIFVVHLLTSRPYIRLRSDNPATGRRNS